METFLDKNLRHSQSNLNDLTEKVRNAELPESIASLYELCLKAEKEQDFINSRDVKLATGFLIQLLFFASPILYSIDNLSLKLKLILFLNPPLHLLLKIWGGVSLRDAGSYYGSLQS